MKITDFINRRAATINLKSNDKEGVIKELVDLLIRTREVKPADKDSLVKILIDRELLGSTGIGQGIGIPHGKSPKIRKLIGAIGISKEGVNFDSLDGEPAHIFFLLLAPQESAGPHLKALARISRLLKDRYFQDMLKKAKSEKELINFIIKEDQKKH
ncbi:MAG: PTS sugar transporter subunit IIA [Candidatus Omnitrophota bacterium]|nr:MAG: PTS sugar transporter subunit IIA [Candidatus Omnitrophota bacterium]